MDTMKEEACATARVLEGATVEVGPPAPSARSPVQVAQGVVSFGDSTALANATWKTMMVVTLLCSAMVATLAWLVFLAWLLIQAARLLI